MGKISVFIVAILVLIAGQLSAMPNPDGVFTCTFPDRKITVIQDLSMTMPGSLFKSINPQEKTRPESSYPAALNVFVIQDRLNGKTCLIDAGYGKPDSRLLKRLARINLAPADIDDIFITHIHPDHVGGLTSPEGEILFPNAKIGIARKEYEEWSRDPARSGLAKHLKPYQKQLRLLDYDREIKPYGLTPLYYPGHTPGHTVYRMEIPNHRRKKEVVYFVGDIVHAAKLQIPHPEFCARFDMEPETAVKSRRELLLHADCWFGAHIAFPGKIRIKRSGNPESSEIRFGFEPGKISFQRLRCPVCFQSDFIRRIVYGEVDSNLKDALERGEVISGGCRKAPETHDCLFCRRELVPLLRKIGEVLRKIPELKLYPEPAWREYSQGKVRMKVQCGWKCGNISVLIMPDSMRFKPNQGLAHLRIPLRKNSPLALYITAPKEQIQTVHHALMKAFPPVQNKNR